MLCQYERKRPKFNFSGIVTQCGFHVGLESRLSSSGPVLVPVERVQKCSRAKPLEGKIAVYHSSLRLAKIHSSSPSQHILDLTTESKQHTRLFSLSVTTVASQDAPSAKAAAARQAREILHNCWPRLSRYAHHIVSPNLLPYRVSTAIHVYLCCQRAHISAVWVR
jgi:hypothetical protein